MTFSVRRHDIVAIALLLMIAAALLMDVVAGSSVFYFRDLTRYYFPVKKMMRDIVLGGEFPSWTRAYSGGQPIAANPEHEVFYPPTWLILLPNYRFGFHLEILAHLAVALIGITRFCGRSSWCPSPHSSARSRSDWAESSSRISTCCRTSTASPGCR